jgi:hypothetical protein
VRTPRRALRDEKGGALGAQACKPVAKSDGAIVIPFGVVRKDFLGNGALPKTAEAYPFEDDRRQAHCWHLGKESPSEFAARTRVVGMQDKLFNSNVVKIFYPIQDRGGGQGSYFAVRQVTLHGNATTARVLCAIEQTAALATAYHMRNDLGVDMPVFEDIKRRLEGAVVCYLMCKRAGGGNHVYVRLSSA